MRSFIIMAICAQILGCARIVKVAKKPDAKEPAPEKLVLDVSAVLAAGNSSASVYGTADRVLEGPVLVGPNLVLGVSRSSLDEAETLGPAGAKPPAPNLSDALGRPISVASSSRLLDHLFRRGTKVIVPAVAKRWRKPSTEGERGATSRATWVERLLQVWPRRSPDGATPAAALAVRELGVSLHRMPVIIQQRDGRLYAAPRQSDLEPSLCEDVVVQIPVVSFAAELISAEDGRLLARIFERRTFTSVPPLRSIIITEWQPVEAVAYAAYQVEPRTRERVGQASSRYRYVKSWKSSDVLCTSAVAELDEVMQLVQIGVRDGAGTTLETIINESLSRLH